MRQATCVPTGRLVTCGVSLTLWHGERCWRAVRGPCLSSAFPLPFRLPEVPGSVGQGQGSEFKVFPWRTGDPQSFSGRDAEVCNLFLSTFPSAFLYLKKWTKTKIQGNSERKKNKSLEEQSRVSALSVADGEYMRL